MLTFPVNVRKFQPIQTAFTAFHAWRMQIIQQLPRYATPPPSANLVSFAAMRARQIPNHGVFRRKMTIARVVK